MEATTTPRRRGIVAQPLEVATLPNALLTIRTVRALVAMSPATIYRRLAEGNFPAPVRLSSRCTRWRAGDVTAWLSRQAAKA